MHVSRSTFAHRQTDRSLRANAHSLLPLKIFIFKLSNVCLQASRVCIIITLVACFRTRNKMTHTFEHSTPMGRGLPPFNPTTVRINTTSHLADGTPIDMAAMKFALAVKPAKAFESSRKNSGQQQYPVLPANTHDIYMSSNDENNRWPDTASDSGNDVEMIGGSVNDTTKRQNLTDVFNESVEIQTEWMGTSLHLDEENLFIQADHENVSAVPSIFLSPANSSRVVCWP